MENKNNTKKIEFYFHAGSSNHGCEAIVCSTSLLLPCTPALISNAPAEDRKYGLDQYVNIQSKSNWRSSRGEKLIIKAMGDPYAYKMRAKHESQDYPAHSVAMSVGGDNYCYGDAYNWHLAGLNTYLHKRHVKTVLWGCSIEPKTINKQLAADLGKYDLIVARESISYNVLKNLNPNTILACDPAFTLPAEDVALPDRFLPGQTIGINISPLILHSESVKGVTLDNYLHLIDHIIENTSYNIALIPHVVSQGNDDRTSLLELYNHISVKERVCIIDDSNCRALKGYISNCAMFIGARTHSTIAAYSTCVPTLVIGYSTKATGIARDLFDDEAHYVLPVQSLRSRNQLVDAFEYINQNQATIKDRLQKTIPEYSSTIKKGIEKVLEL